MVEEALRATGISVIGDVPWGTHFCQFYKTKEDLLELLVPYFKEGLAHNEFCMWVTSEPLSVAEATASLRHTLADLGRYLEREQIEIIPYTDWYHQGGTFDADRALRGWMAKLDQARARGFEGLRLTGNAFWVESTEWQALAAYEEQFNRANGQFRMVALCTYSLDKCGASEIIDVVSNHRFALAKREDQWTLIERAERKQTEDAMRRSKEQFRSLVLATAQIVWITDAHGHATADIPAWRQYTGQSYEELRGTGWIEALHPDDRDRTMAVWREAVRTRSLYDTEYRVRRYDGVYQDFSVRGVPILEPDGTVREWVGTCTDITERKRMEEHLLGEKNFTNAVLDSLPGIFYMFDESGRFTRWNRNFESVTRYSTQEISQVSPLDFFGGADRSLIEARIQQVFARGRSTAEANLISKDGTSTPYFFTGQLFVSGPQRYLVGMGIDISESKRAEEVLRQSEFRFHTMADYTWDWEFWMGSDRRFVYVSPSCERITQYSRTEFMEAPSLFLDIAHPKDRLAVQAKLEQAFARATVTDVDYRILCKDGTLRWVSMVFQAIMQADGTFLGIRGSIRDITERKEMEEKAGRLARMATIGQLLGGIAHEIKNPLFILTGALQLFREKLLLQEYSTLPADLEKIEATAARLCHILERFLSLAKPYQPSSERCFVQTVLRDTLEFLGNELMKSRIVVHGAIPPDLPPIWADPKQMQEVFLNLSINAIQAMGEAHGQGILTVAAALVNEWIEIRIQDNGPGILPVWKAKLFDPFFSTKPPEQGTGLGLWTVRTILMQLKGTVACETEVGQGTTFIVRLPIWKAEEGGRSLPSRKSA